MDSTGPSKHLSWAELACHDVAHTPYPREWRADRAVELAQAFERVRELYGAPLAVDSAFRTTAYNRSIGGAKDSQHIQGRALDLRPLKPGRLALEALISAARRAVGEGLVRGIGIYSGFVHIDTRPGSRVFSWYGGRSTN